MAGTDREPGSSRQERRQRKAAREPVTGPRPAVPPSARRGDDVRASRHGQHLAWQRLLQQEQPTGPMPIVDRLRGTPFREPRRMDAPRDVQAREAVDLALRLGELLFRAGAGTREVETSLIAATAALGLTHVDVDITVQSILVQHAPPGQPPLTMLRVARGESRDFSRLAAAHRLVDDLVAGRLARADALARLRSIEQAPKPWPRWAVSAAWGLLAASVCMLVGGGTRAVVLAFASSVAVDRLGRLLGRRGVPPFFLTFTGAAVSCVLAVLAVRVGLLPKADADAVVAGGIVALLPGRAIVSAVEDAIAGFVVTASGRLLTVLFNAAAIVGGVGLGLGLARKLDLVLAVDATGTSALDVVSRALAAGVAALATSVANRGRMSHLLPVAAVGVGAYAVSDVLRSTGLTGVTVATAVAAAVVGALARVAGGRLRAPSLVLAVPALSALLPGRTIFRGMSEVAQGASSGVPTLLAAMTTALAIGGGVVLGDLLAAPVDRGVLARRALRRRTTAT